MMNDNVILTTKDICTSQEVKLNDTSTSKQLEKLKKYKIKIMNIGYDLVPTNVVTQYINEK